MTAEEDSKMQNYTMILSGTISSGMVSVEATLELQISYIRSVTGGVSKLDSIINSPPAFVDQLESSYTFDLAEITTG